MHNREVFTRKIETANSSLNFKYEGIPNENNIEREILEKKLDDFFNQNNITEDIVKVVVGIRAIFKDFDEKNLKLIINNKKRNNVFILYKDKKLDTYQMTKKTNEDYAKCFIIEYKIDEGLKYYFSNVNNKIIEYPINQKSLDIINENMKKLVYLNNVESIVLDIEGKVICKLYKLFYDEDVDFSSKNINVKIQAMMFLLQEFGVSLDNEINFIMSKNKMPISIYLYEKVNRLFPLGKIENLGNEVKIYDEASKITKSIGSVVREYMHNSDDEIEVLRKISRVFFAKSNCLRVNAQTDEIAEYCHYSNEEVDSALKLIRKMKQKVED